MKEERKAERKKSDDIALSIHGLSKIFKIPHERRYTLFENILGILSFDTSYEKFYALKNIDIEIKKGEFIGLIGNNGSGKSTLLKTISKILMPTTGEIYLDGRITEFLDLGVGFQDELTAKENIFLYGAIMGLSREYIKSKLGEILNFADVEKFADTKLKSFSAGMRVRLAFATAIQTNPEILLLDEVLAVGDSDFQKKCYELFKSYKGTGVTIIFASHNLDDIREFCDRTIYLDKSRIVMFEKTSKVLEEYDRRHDKVQ